jgi:eukaryotic-like serine/threonine-protein kinase
VQKLTRDKTAASDAKTLMPSTAPQTEIHDELQGQLAASCDITHDQISIPAVPSISEPAKSVIPPSSGEVIESQMTGNSYTMGEGIGEGYFGLVFSCIDAWGNELAAKVMKPLRTYEEVKASAESELQKLFAVRHPYVTYVFDAFEYRDTFYIITERCYRSLADLLTQGEEVFQPHLWLKAIARCLLQAVHFIHLNGFVHQDIHLGNVFIAFARDESDSAEAGAIQFKLGDLGVAKLFSEIDAAHTRGWMLPPEVIDQSEFGKPDQRIDVYHCGLLFLQLAYGQELRFTVDEIRAGKPREMALQLPAPLNFALEKALRRHVAHRTGNAMELWHDLSRPAPKEIPPTATTLLGATDNGGEPINKKEPSVEQ